MLKFILSHQGPSKILLATTIQEIVSLRSGNIIPWLLVTAVICLPACSREGDQRGGGEPVTQEKKEVSSVELSLDDVTLYVTDIWEIDRMYREEGVFRVIGELGGRAGKKDAKALTRLIEILLTSDAYMTENLVVTLAALFKTDPEFFLNHTWQMEKERRDLAYKAIIYENYYGEVFGKNHPPIWNDLKKMGVVSTRFRNMFEYYLANPGHLEDWSVNPPG